MTAIRDQIVIGTRYQHIREEAFLKSWNLASLRTEGMKLESALQSSAEIGGESVNKLGPYSFKNIKNNKNNNNNNNNNNNKNNSADNNKPSPRSCYFCGET